jgi:uncharacterized protein YdeI (YjbR/CyaY-like superfamily)
MPRAGIVNVAKTPVQQLPEPPLYCAGTKQWDAWLRKHHAGSVGVWLRISKKGASEASVSYPDALELALCFGWIDAIKKNDGPHHWLQRFTPRAKRSIWSKVNREKALKLVELGRMQPAGLKEMQRAQADGRWQAAYDGVSSATVPPDLQAAFDAQPGAQAFFETLNSSNRYAVLFRLQTAKLPATRARRIEQFVAMLARGEKLHP